MAARLASMRQQRSGASTPLAVSPAPTSPAPQPPDTIRFKCTFDTVHRNMYLPKPVKYEKLVEQIRRLFAQPLDVTYLDADRDQVRIHSQEDLDDAIHLARNEPNNLVKLILVEMGDESAIASEVPSSLPRRSSGALKGHDIFAHQFAEEAEIRKRNGSRHSPPPGFLHTDRARSNSTASGRGAFHDINGGGEFIPEHGVAQSVSGYFLGPPAPAVYPHLTDGTLTVRSNASSLSNYTDDGSAKTTPSSRDFFPDRFDAESGIDTLRTVDLEMRSTVPRTFADSGARRRPLEGPQTLPRESSRTASYVGPSDATISRQMRQLDIQPLSRSTSAGEGYRSDPLRRVGPAPVLEDRKPRRWKKGARLGSGAFGQVFKAYNDETGEEVAVKQVDLHPESGADNLKEVQSLEAEIETLRNLRHDRIVMYYGTERTADSLCIFMEYISGGSVAQRLRTYGAFAMPTVKKFTRQILEGLAYLHENGIVHRDIKGANVLVTTGGDIKLADFGASKRLQAMRTLTGFKSVHGTPFWMAPEVIDGKGYGRRSDIWSVGCTAVEMMQTVPPNHDCEPMAALFKIGSPSEDFTVHIPKDAPPDCRRFLTLCFRRDKSARPHAYELLRDAFVNDIKAGGSL